MTLKVLITIFSFILPTFCQGSENNEIEKIFKLPPSKILKEEISSLMGSPYFIEKTNLHDRIGGKELNRLGIKFAVELAIYDYTESLEKGDIQVPLSTVDSLITLANVQKKQIINTIINSSN